MSQNEKFSYLFEYIWYCSAMPELPEVEVLRRDLESRFPKPARLTKVHLLSPKLRTPLVWPSRLKNKSIEVLSLKRRSKYLIFITDSGVFISHLGMSGYWRVETKPQKLKHDHVMLEWENGDFWVYNDPRRFGVFEYYPDETKVKWFRELGPEPFSDDFFHPDVFQKIKRSDRAIKSIIMDAKVLVGVGNIYASEALFAAKIQPFKSGKKISKEKITELLNVIRQTLSKAIEAGGSSISDYVHANGEEGNFQNEHLVYAREGELCHRCTAKIKMKKCQGRSTFWCSKCQT